jgi:hypothetical protein
MSGISEQKQYIFTTIIDRPVVEVGGARWMIILLRLLAICTPSHPPRSLYPPQEIK